MSNRLQDIELFAWLGEDELGSGEIGLKQALVPAGMIAIVATARDKVDAAYIREQLSLQAHRFGKPIHLCRFVLSDVIRTLQPIGREQEAAPRLPRR